MIEVNVKVHDKYSIEFKTGYNIVHNNKPNEFSLNIWFFVPNSLDINPQTYSKKQFYRDIKANIRLITPSYGLCDIAGGRAEPLANLENALRKLAASPSKASVAEYEYQIKMFIAIFKSSLRNQIYHIMRSPESIDKKVQLRDLIDGVHAVTGKYRALLRIIDVPAIASSVRNYYYFGDEFLSNLIDKYIIRFDKYLRSRYGGKYMQFAEEMTDLIIKETDYRRRQGYPVASGDSRGKNREIIFRYGVLKKYIESELFLRSRKKREGVLVEQIYLSLAAGLSMVFATAIAFSAQQKYGNFTMPLFVALVVSYMLKDRIKELMRYYFAHKRGTKYFDNKTEIKIEDNDIGWIKEGVDFITEDKVPVQVMDIRNRSYLLQAENRVNDEKILLYRKLVSLDSAELDKGDGYFIAGINDITRLHLNTFTNKMDNPEESLYVIDDNREITKITGEKIYYLNTIIQMQHGEQTEYKRFQIVFNRSGIKEIEEFK